MSPVERVLVWADKVPVGPLLRIALGFTATALWLAIRGHLGSWWLMLPYFLSVLIAIRAVPLVARRVVRFGPEIRVVWTQRRDTAKRFDSYQWQKMFWFALGMWLKLRESGSASRPLQVLTYVALGGGCLGLALWLNRRGRSGGAQPDATGLAPNGRPIRTNGGS